MNYIFFPKCQKWYWLREQYLLVWGDGHSKHFDAMLPGLVRCLLNPSTGLFITTDRVTVCHNHKVLILMIVRATGDKKKKVCGIRKLQEYCSHFWSRISPCFPRLKLIYNGKLRTVFGQTIKNLCKLSFDFLNIFMCKNIQIWEHTPTRLLTVLLSESKTDYIFPSKLILIHIKNPIQINS